MNIEEEHLKFSIEKDFSHCMRKSSLTPISMIKKTIYLYGFPNDEGKNNTGSRVGSEKGPFSFRKGLENYHFNSFKNIESIAVIDEGNAPHNILLDNSLLETHQTTQNKIKQLLSLKDSVAFVVGGSNDMTFSNFKGLADCFPVKSIGIININAHLNVEVENKISKFCSNSTFRLISQDNSFKDSHVCHFAIQGAQNSLNDYKFVEENKGKILFLDKNIRRFKVNKDHPEFSTQAGQSFEIVLQQMSCKVDIIMISFDLDSIDSRFCPGVSVPSVIGGLSDLEAEEIFTIIGRNQKVLLVDVAEFNPAVEDTRTRKLVVTLFYKFCKAVSER